MKIPRPQALRFAPFLPDLRAYHPASFRADLFAAIAVALMTIPQSIAYALLANLPPTAGLYAAIFGTIFTAAFGDSRVLICGPSTGTAILIQTSIADVIYTVYDQVPAVQHEALALRLLMQLVLMVGLIQIGAACFNISKLLQFVSRPVILGYFGGITIAIAITQLFAFTGIAPPTGGIPLLYRAGIFLSHLTQIHWTTLAVGVFSLWFLLTLRRYFKNWPNALIMLVFSSVLTYGINHWTQLSPITTLGDFALPQNPVPTLDFPWMDLKALNQLFPAAVAIGFLGILEVFSVSRSFTVRAGQKMQINQDIFGLGISNFMLSFLFGAMANSASATRTALNFRLQSKTRFAAIFSSLITAVIVFFCWPLVKKLPLAALAALLIATVHTLMDLKEIKLTFRATREDAWVFMLTFLSCLLFRLDIAFFIGIVISIATYLKKSSTPHLVEYAFNAKGRLMTLSPKEDVHRKVRIIGIGGELYFAAADVFQSALQSVAEDRNVQAIILRLNNVYHMDASMCLAILHLFETLQSSGRYLVISGLTEEVWHVFHRAGIVKQIGLENLYFTDESNPQFSTWKAALRAQELIHKSL